MLKLLTTALALAMLATTAQAQQGNLPAPRQKLPPYPPVVCVTPDWRPESCEDRNASGWQCGNVKVTVSHKGDWSMEFLITGTVKSDNRFTLVGPKDELYLNGKLCTPFGGKTKPESFEEKTEPEAPPAPASESWHPPPGITIINTTPPKMVVHHNGGGFLNVFTDLFSSVARADGPAEVRGRCGSGCTMITAYFPKDRLCFGEDASLDFHQARSGTSDGPPAPETTRWMISHYPQDIRLWIRAKGDAEKMPLHGFWTLTAHELWEMGYQKCAA